MDRIKNEKHGKELKAETINVKAIHRNRKKRKTIPRKTWKENEKKKKALEAKKSQTWGQEAVYTNPTSCGRQETDLSY